MRFDPRLQEKQLDSLNFLLYFNQILCEKTRYVGSAEFSKTTQSSNTQNDNAIVGDPAVECADNYFEIRFDTRNPFQGLVFVQDHLEDFHCRSAAITSTSQQNTSLRLDFKGCGIERRISTSPRGLFLATSIIVAFNSDFLTKVDRVYRVQCFYMEMERQLEKEIAINMPPPQLHKQQVTMPVCKYEVLDGSPKGKPVYYATVGQMVYHKWTCEAEKMNTFCMVVHSCFVDDGNGERVQLINDKGCALDKYLLTNLEYPEDLVAGREAHVYKYADRDNMYFDCQITLRIKEPGTEYCEVKFWKDIFDFVNVGKY
ncbi:zona pellucida-like domain protein [Dictyocaulus viviparus]|uniref:Zona pellucida-like domain protein n=1 Tax=Dictyocaulus viviparus TaxID=29172 RepID=A0A0D8XDI3_DICVI|nr:zona pellucida-like domain protein [Dictyocaulus viviparus]